MSGSYEAYSLPYSSHDSASKYAAYTGPFCGADIFAPWLHEIPSVSKRGHHNRGRPHCVLSCNPEEVLEPDDYRCLLVPDNELGRSQLAWLVNCGLIPADFDLYSTDNMLPACLFHTDDLDVGRFVLCPPLRDLHAMVAWELDDWQARVQSSTPRPRAVPPAQRLSGRFCVRLHRLPLQLRRIQAARGDRRHAFGASYTRAIT
ncbi:hypothetical protein OH77DRAFT_1270693 [Trametes cingulata]|nr:hypothetical protein OH77DRAFT_1270693 [Trametes cingulata]